MNLIPGGVWARRYTVQYMIATSHANATTVYSNNIPTAQQTADIPVEDPWSTRSKVQRCQGIGRGCATLVDQGTGAPWHWYTSLSI